MRTEIKTFHVVCDRCKLQEVVYSHRAYCDLPAGWGTREINACGLTNLGRPDDLCPECLTKKHDD